ncbi:hypothetical protein [Rhizobium sp. LC145]|uniref:head-tail connector protein n=1 Tax=Rhizobium sp. LC145 TaxID=1120688 RepID=UPI00062A2C9B|nr:hypothetical protein [Rhizobium sp. LC145]KKX28231.1 hypothetical protein YH62_19275 [Rhizobium sp. LC145]TKT58349.1 hypothetical protein FDR95_12130 [Rhizobiaceae bacterium LC148]
MRRPVLVTPASALPVTVAEVKGALRIDGADLDSEIESQIKSAVEYYEGWSGILGVCLVEQTWRQSFDRFERCLMLPLRPVQSITSVNWRNAAGETATVATSNYALETDDGGLSFVRFKRGYAYPSGLADAGAVSVEYIVGWPLAEGKPTTPESIKAAIKIRVQMHIDEAAKQGADVLEKIESRLIGTYRSVGL